MFTKGVVCAALLASSFNAIAADWRQVPGTKPLTILIDQSSLSRSGDHVKYRARISWADAPPEIAAKVDYQMVHADINCAERSNATISVTQYNKRHDSLGVKPGEPNKFVEIIPDSTGERVLEAVCKK